MARARVSATVGRVVGTRRCTCARAIHPKLSRAGDRVGMGSMPVGRVTKEAGSRTRFRRTRLLSTRRGSRAQSRLRHSSSAHRRRRTQCHTASLRRHRSSISDGYRGESLLRRSGGLSFFVGSMPVEGHLDLLEPLASLRFRLPGVGETVALGKDHVVGERRQK